MLKTTNNMLPYTNLEMQNQKGEIWKDVIGYEGCYKVSNLGRVKSLDRTIPHPRLYEQFVKGKMLKQKIVKDHNRITGDAMITLQVALSNEGATHYYNVRRLVFISFKKRLDFLKDGLYVINKDGNGFNNKLSNLIAVEKSEKQRRSIESGRQNFDYLKSIDRSGWKKNYSRRIPVNQYSLQGKLLNRYVSIDAAHKATGFDAKGISNAAKGMYKGRWSGFKWKFAK